MRGTRIAAVVGAAFAAVLLAQAAAAGSTAPTTQITSGPTGSVASTTARFTFTSNTSKATFECKLDSRGWSSCSSPMTYSGLAQGAHTFSVYARATGKNDATPATASWTVDTVAPPAPSVTGAPAAVSNQPTATFAFSDQDSTVTFSCQLDGGAVGRCSTPITYSGLPDGPHRFTVRAVDSAGNTSPSTTSSWTIDTTPPPAPTITSAPPSSTADTSASFAFTDTDSGTGFVCALDLGSPSACTSPASFSGLTPGSHTFSVVAADAAGNKSAPASDSWTIAAATNYLSNASFEGSVSGWSSFNGSLALVHDGTDGSDAAQVSLTGSETSFTVYPTQRPVTSTTAGTSYTAGGWVRSDVPGKTVCIRIREFDSGGNQIGESESCTGTTTTWQRFTPVSYTTTVSGGQITAFAIEKSSVAGDTFEVDGLYLNEGGSSPAPPPPPSANYLSNPSFEGSLAGWSSFNGSLALASDGEDGTNAAKVTMTSADTNYTIYPSVKPISSTVAGKPFAATGWVRSDTPGKTVCIRIREFGSSGAQLGQHDSCVTATSAWQQFPPVRYTTAGSGGQLTAFVIQTPAAVGDSFEVDGLQLTDDTGPTTGWNSTDPIVAAAGDTACAPTDPDYHDGDGTGTRCMQKATAAVIGSIDHLADLLPLGDNQYQCGALADFQAAYGPTWGQYNSLAHPVPGNHEYGDFASGCTASDAAGYYQYFGLIAGDPRKGYYSYDVGAWHLIALNSDCRAVGGCGSGSPEETWLQNDLATHSNTCTLAYWHIPAFSNGWVGDDLSDYGAWWSDLYAAHADLVINGHDHTYQRFQPMNAAGVPDPSGPTEVIVGTGGEELMPAPDKTSRLVVGNSTTFGVLKLQLHDTGYDAQFLPIAGQTFSDSFSGTCVG